MRLISSLDAQQPGSYKKRKLSVFEDESDFDQNRMGKTNQMFSNRLDPPKIWNCPEPCMALIKYPRPHMLKELMYPNAESRRHKITQEGDSDSDAFGRVIISDNSSQSSSKDLNDNTADASSTNENNTQSIDAEIVAKEAAKAAEKAEYEKTKSRWYRTFNGELQQNIKDMTALVETSAAQSEAINTVSFQQLAGRCEILLRACKEKYIAATERKPKKPKVIQGPHPATAEELNLRLRGPAELKFP
jgi:hypothetical protein